MQKENRSKVLNIRFSEPEMEKLRLLMKRSGRFEYFSGFIRRLILTQADKEVQMAK